jgi:hypothetical protein
MLFDRNAVDATAAALTEGPTVVSPDAYSVIEDQETDWRPGRPLQRSISRE